MSNNSIPSDFKPLFIQWIEDEAIKATKKGSKLAILYNKSLDQLRTFDLPINDLKTLKSIKFVGEKTVSLLRKRIDNYCNDNNWSIPLGFLEKDEQHSLNLKNTRNSNPGDSIDQRPTKRAKTTRKYVPKNRSGGFAILIALYLKDKIRKGLTRDQITTIATPYSDKSFISNPSSKEFHSAWNSIKTLINQDLVVVSGRSPKLYYLTDEGESLAKQLKTTTEITSSPISNNNYVDTSFDNGVRLNSSGILDSSSPIRELHNPAHSNKFILDELDKLNNNSSKFHTNHHNLNNDMVLNNNKFQHDSKNRCFNNVRYEIWQPQDYEIILYIDNRELRSSNERDYYQKRLSLGSIKCEIKTLASGDALWIARNLKTKNESILNFICERKRIDDLCDSIKDGRFQEQKNRMSKSGMKHCYYIIEEMMVYKDHVIDLMESIKTSISQTMTNAHYYLRRFSNIDETVNFLNGNTQVIKEILSNTNLIVLKPSDIKNQDHYLDILLSFRNKFENSKSSKYECVHLFSSFQDLLVKSKQMTVKEMFILMLMTIRGCSLEKAITIQKKFPTPKSLLLYYQKNRLIPIEIQKKLLMDEFKDQIGNKKIGKVLSEKIWDIWGNNS
ncbi:unnamed protein product [Candida verbasci]|uniref:Crossover junction endonuclease MUS81 n=1 Tax=Candida verbasci TaxID=1227364 RepID=A0A9W4XFS3_9ASCO|nr:unnamed protein product [Candida verbasci]